MKCAVVLSSLFAVSSAAPAPQLDILSGLLGGSSGGSSMLSGLLGGGSSGGASSMLSSFLGGGGSSGSSSMLSGLLGSSGSSSSSGGGNFLSSLLGGGGNFDTMSLVTNLFAGSSAAPSGCAPFEIIIARGTYEPGPFGVIVGDPLVAGVKRIVPQARGYAVNYPADASSGSKQAGVADVLRRLQQQHQACPNEKFAIVGYSQGASVMHAAADQIPAAIQQKILAVVMFGDPGRILMSFPRTLQSRLYENCAPADMVCGNIGLSGGGHLTYIEDQFQNPSAQFVASAFQGRPMQAKTM